MDEEVDEKVKDTLQGIVRQLEGKWVIIIWKWGQSAACFAPVLSLLYK